jgi:NTP pyrophosphatase (non-canonical NTP hydrolase)
MNKEILERAICHYGTAPQIIKAIEELGELTTALSKWMNNYQSLKPIVDEIADVKIMLAQLEIIFDIDIQVHNRVNFKLKRLAKRLNGI